MPRAPGRRASRTSAARGSRRSRRPSRRRRRRAAARASRAENGRNASAGTKTPRKSASAAEPRHGVAVQPPPAGRVDHAEQPRHPADRRCQQNDDCERDERAPHDLEMVGEDGEHRMVRAARRSAGRRAWRLLRPVEAVAGVAETGDDEAALVQARGRPRRTRCARRDGARGCTRCRAARRRCRRASRLSRPPPSPPRSRRRSSGRSRASGRARARRARSGRPAASRSTAPAAASPRRGTSR